jgi:lipoprotein NlpD
VKLQLKSPKVLVAALLVTAMFLSSAPTARAQATCSPSHVVKKGENLFRIALANGTTWPILAQMNNLANPNLILVGQVICLPGSVPATPAAPTPIAPTPVAPTPGPAPAGTIQVPPAGVFPRISFNTQVAGPGDTIIITGVDFPTNEAVDIFIAPTRSPWPTTPSGSAVTAADGTLNTNFKIPTDVEGVALRGSSLSIMVRGRTTGYFGYNFFANPRP